MAQIMAAIDEVIEAHGGWPLTGSIGYPTVSQDTGRVRTLIMATHTKEELGYALEVFGQVGRPGRLCGVVVVLGFAAVLLEDVFHCGCGLVPHRRRPVAVEVHGDPDAGVPEERLDEFRMDALGLRWRRRELFGTPRGAWVSWVPTPYFWPVVGRRSWHARSGWSPW